MIEVRRYTTASGKDLFGTWLADLRDRRAKVKIVMRIDRIAEGNSGDCKALGGGLHELRIDSGPGYRVYYAMIGKVCILLLCGGDKSKQSADIERARNFLKDYKERINEL